MNSVNYSGQHLHNPVAIPSMQKLVLASNSAGKVREFTALFAPLGIAIIPQGDLGIAAAEEPYFTFVENALTKARHASKESNLPALADDSGICIAALDGKPGVRSARYAGSDGCDAQNNAKVIAELRGISDRRAHYVCALVFIRHALDPEPVIVQTQWHGEFMDFEQDWSFTFPNLFCRLFVFSQRRQVVWRCMCSCNCLTPPLPEFECS